jgi:hypothetical protein
MMAAGPIRAFLAAGVAALVAAGVLAAASGRMTTRVRAAAALVAAGLALGAIFPAAFDPYVALPAVRQRIQRFEWNHLARTDAVRPGRYVIDGDASTDVIEDIATQPAPEYTLVKKTPTSRCSASAPGRSSGSRCARTQRRCWRSTSTRRSCAGTRSTTARRPSACSATCA